MAYEVSFRKRVLRCLEEGRSIVETAKLFGISVSSIKTWRKKQAAGNLVDPIRKRTFKKLILRN